MASPSVASVDGPGDAMASHSGDGSPDPPRRRPGARVLRLFTVDAFTTTPFSGNPAAVVLVPGDCPLSDAERQRIAQELNLSETAFVEVDGAGPGGGYAESFATASRFVLRWFTPTTEVTLCGHATLAAAHVLTSELGNPSPRLRFRTVKGAGVLFVSRHVQRSVDDDPPGFWDDDEAEAPRMLQMSLPMAEPGEALPEALKAESAQRALVRALGLEWDSRTATDASKDFLIANGPLLFAAGGGLNYVLVTCCFMSAAPKGRYSPGASTRLLNALKPDRDALLSAVPPGSGVAGVIVAVDGDTRKDSPFYFDRTCPEEYVCASRFFGPWMGIDEDPVTGSAHCVLAPYYAPNETWRWARQCSARGGDLRIRCDHGAQRVLVAGNARTVVRGEMELQES